MWVWAWWVLAWRVLKALGDSTRRVVAAGRDLVGVECAWMNARGSGEKVKVSQVFPMEEK